MTPRPLVSVVLIFLNEERFLPDAIASVLAQSYDHWELLLVDDGSSDRSGALARQAAIRDPRRVRYLTHPGAGNFGMSASRNLGIRAARGEVLSFIDGDDVWLPGKLERQVPLLVAHPEAALVAGRTELWYGWTGIEADRARDFVQPLHVPLDTLVEAPRMLTAFLHDEYASLSDIVVRRESAAAVGGYESEFRGLYEDQVFHAKLCARYPIVTTNNTGYRYRQHAESCVYTESREGRRLEARLRFLQWLTAYLEEQQITDRELWQVLRRETLPFRSPLLARLRGVYRRVRERALGRSMPGASR